MEPNEGFFRIFEYNNSMHDAIDYGIVYEDCKILTDLTIKPDIDLVLDQHFAQVVFNFKHETFAFVKSWVKGDDNIYHPGDGSFIISQKDLAPFMKW